MTVSLQKDLQNVDICAPVLRPIINNALQDFLFPDELKLADLGPLPKGDEKTNKKNYRPVSSGIQNI